MRKVETFYFYNWWVFKKIWYRDYIINNNTYGLSERWWIKDGQYLKDYRLI